MPLLIALLCFAVLFCGEAIWLDAKKMAREQELRRYAQVEHPRRHSGPDRYLDLLA